MTEFIRKLNFLLTRRDKQFLAGLFGLSLFVALIETVGISITNCITTFGFVMV
jgi:hypothetical protein